MRSFLLPKILIIFITIVPLPEMHSMLYTSRQETGPMFQRACMLCRHHIKVHTRLVASQLNPDTIPALMVFICQTSSSFIPCPVGKWHGMHSTTVKEQCSQSLKAILSPFTGRKHQWWEVKQKASTSSQESSKEKPSRKIRSCSYRILISSAWSNSKTIML